ncbi:glycosyltransferase family 4 protein [Citrobacter werkmanii]|nr:glycosyltransferase family 4 protein [Citrobacter werkmanii]
MKNIAFIITKSEIGGAQTWVNEIANLMKDDCNVYLITSDHGWLTQSNNFHGVYIIPGVKNYFSISAYFKLIKFLRDKKITSLVASSANAGIYARLAKLAYRFNCVYVSHGWSCLYNGGRLKNIFCKIEKYLSFLTDTIWCISESDKEKAIKLIGISDKKVVMVTNSVPAMPAYYDKPVTNKILFVGRLTHPKRPELLARVIANKQQYTLDIIGGGERLETLKVEFQQFKNIHFLGEVKNFTAYNQYDLFSLISDSEGLPMSGLEAHTAGIPLLLSDVGGCFELIDGNGLLVNNSEHEIEEKLDFIFANYAMFREKAAVSADKFVINNYSNLYKQIIFTENAQ